MANKSRAEYFKKRRETLRHFNELLPNEKADAIEKRLQEIGKTKTAWLLEKIDEELEK